VVGARRAGIVAVVLAALTMGLAFAHTLELPQKLDYDAATWTQIQHTLYRYFAVIGGPLEVAGSLPPWCRGAGSWAARRPAGRGRRGLLVVALGWWFAVVNTANVEVGRWAVDAVPSDCGRWRAQWEFGHAGHFVVTFAGFLALLGATVRVSALDRRVPGRS
jgi:hypothetical protein